MTKITPSTRAVICTQSEHSHQFTVGRIYPVRWNAHGPLTTDDKGKAIFIGRTAKHITSLYLNIYVTTFEPASGLARVVVYLKNLFNIQCAGQPREAAASKSTS